MGNRFNKPFNYLFFAVHQN